MLEDIDHNSLVLYYSPYCEYSKTFRPTFEDLAMELVGQSDLIIGKFDTSANEVEGLTL